MTPYSTARSISRSVRERLLQGPRTGQVLAVFQHACQLIDQDGELIALVNSQIGDGPLNVVLDGAADLFSEFHPGTLVTLEVEQFTIATWQICWSGAAIWEPRPDWHTLRARRSAIDAHLPLLLDLCLRHAPAGSLLALLDAPGADTTLTEGILSKAREAARVLHAGWESELQRLEQGVAALAGLGHGLTPAGDDFLSGVMLWAWLTHSSPESLCHAILQQSAPRTTTLSAAFLRAAARGECSAPWHRLLTALSQELDVHIESAVLRILTQGATSGADTLSGFLYMAGSCGT